MLYKIINTYADESDFILNLIDDHPYIGWYMLLRLGESDTTKATLTRRECIEINKNFIKNWMNICMINMKHLPLIRCC